MPKLSSKEAEENFASKGRFSVAALRRFRADVRASTAVEFAMICVPFFGLIFCIIELGIVLLVGTAVESTTQQIARLIKTGQLQQANIMTASDFRTKLLCPSSGQSLLPTYLTCGRLIFDVRILNPQAAADLNDDIYASGANLKFCPGGSQSIVIVRIAYAFPAILPMLAMLPSGSVIQSRAGLVNNVANYAGWNHMIFKVAAFENENFGGAVTACP